ncbi:hypothetical protein ACLBP9_31615, partial [Klebsiella pneumoniae]
MFNNPELLGASFSRQATRHSLEIAGWSSLLGLLIAVLGSHSMRLVHSRPSHPLPVCILLP